METNIAINNDAPALSGDIALIEDRTSGQPYLFVTATDGANNLLVNRYTIAAGTDAVAGQNVATIPGAFGSADMQLSQKASKLLVEYYTETLNPVTFTAKGEIMVYELDANYLPVAGVTDGIELTGETPERGSAIFSASGNKIYYRDENTADGYIRSIDLENANTIDPLSDVTGNLLTAYNSNTYLTAGPDDNLYHWQEGEGVDFEVVSNSLIDILPQLSVKTGQSATGPVIQYVTRHLGQKYYELKDHLGNVRATISDLRTMQAGIAQASMESYNNYYPFGMLMPGRWNSSENYRYGFNGKEMDNDMKGGTGAVYDYGFRIYDSRIAKFLSVDPFTKEYPWYTPYQFAGNTPIQAIDLDGLEDFYVRKKLPSGKEIVIKQPRNGDRFQEPIPKGAKADLVTNPIHDPTGEFIIDQIPVVGDGKAILEVGVDAYNGEYASVGEFTKDLLIGVAVGTVLRKAYKEYVKYKKNVGIIYNRKDLNGIIQKDYKGQAKSKTRYEKRQKEHARDNPNSDFEFEIIDKGDPTGDFPTDLDKKEQKALDAGGGPTNKSNPNGGTSNKKDVIKKKK